MSNQFSTENMATPQLALLQERAKELPDCYNSFEDFLWDFWPNFSWNSEGRAPQLKFLLALAGIDEVCEEIKTKYGFDMKEELETVLCEDLKISKLNEINADLPAVTIAAPIILLLLTLMYNIV